MQSPLWTVSSKQYGALPCHVCILAHDASAECFYPQWVCVCESLDGAKDYYYICEKCIWIFFAASAAAAVPFIFSCRLAWNVGPYFFVHHFFFGRGLDDNFQCKINADASALVYRRRFFFARKLFFVLCSRARTRESLFFGEPKRVCSSWICDDCW